MKQHAVFSVYGFMNEMLLRELLFFYKPDLMVDRSSGDSSIRRCLRHRHRHRLVENAINTKAPIRTELYSIKLQQLISDTHLFIIF